MGKKSKSGSLRSAWIVCIVLLVIVVAAEILAHSVMTNFYSINVSNVWIENDNGLKVRGKLYVPKTVSSANPAPGVVYLHGYQNNRETSDPYAIELSRRGIVVLNIDTLGRGNSDNQFSEDMAGFDPTYGGRAAFDYLCSLPFVDENRCGMGGHSLGGEMAYTAAMEDPRVAALVFSGFAYRTDATTNKPHNMLMIFGKYDEYRKRMTDTRDFRAEWMSGPETEAAFPVKNPEFDTTYGSFEDGTARRVHMTNTTHVGENFDRGALTEVADWFCSAFGTHPEIPAENQIWRIKEIASLIAMIAAVLSLLPLAVILLSWAPFPP